MSRIATVGEFLEDGTGLGVHCLDCHRYVLMELQPVAERFGANYLIVGSDTPFRRSLKCSVCGSRKMQMTVIAPGTVSKGRSLPR
jgi:hypothetical protein